MNEKRIERLERAAAKATRRRLEAMPDNELQALATGCPAWVEEAIERLSDRELDTLLNLPDRDLLPCLEARADVWGLAGAAGRAGGGV
jgi:hypothetical protein